MLFQWLFLCVLPLLSVAAPTADSSISPVNSRNYQPAPYFYQGHDLSSLKMLVETGSIYKDTARQNETRPAEDILGDGGMNSVRLR